MLVTNMRLRANFSLLARLAYRWVCNQARSLRVYALTCSIVRNKIICVVSFMGPPLRRAGRRTKLQKIFSLVHIHFASSTWVCRYTYSTRRRPAWKGPRSTLGEIKLQPRGRAASENAWPTPIPARRPIQQSRKRCCTGGKEN